MSVRESANLQSVKFPRENLEEVVKKVGAYEWDLSQRTHLPKRGNDLMQ